LRRRWIVHGARLTWFLISGKKSSPDRSVSVPQSKPARPKGQNSIRWSGVDPFAAVRGRSRERAVYTRMQPKAERDGRTARAM
jgi:hypothetical protein